MDGFLHGDTKFKNGLLIYNIIRVGALYKIFGKDTIINQKCQNIFVVISIQPDQHTRPHTRLHTRPAYTTDRRRPTETLRRLRDGFHRGRLRLHDTRSAGTYEVVGAEVGFQSFGDVTGIDEFGDGGCGVAEQSADCVYRQVDVGEIEAHDGEGVAGNVECQIEVEAYLLAD